MKRITKKLKRSVFPWFTFLLLQGTNLSFRLQVVNQSGSDGPSFPPGLYCVWHRHIWVSSYFFRRKNFYTLASPSTDGEFITRVLKKLGYRVVRGSSSRKPLTSLKKLFRLIKDEEKIIITPDGPRGPAREVKQGLAHLQKKTGVPLYPLGVAAERKKIFSSWDRFVLPYPFTRVVLLIGSPLDFNDISLVADRTSLIEQKMADCNKQAEQILQSNAGNGKDNQSGDYTGDNEIIE